MNIFIDQIAALFPVVTFSPFLTWGLDPRDVPGGTGPLKIIRIKSCSQIHGSLLGYKVDYGIWPLNCQPL
jgi:hypothetical protein